MFLTCSSSHLPAQSNSGYGGFYKSPSLLAFTKTSSYVAPPTTQRWDLQNIFLQFDMDGDGYLNLGEMQRAFRAIGLKKRSGAKLEVDQAMFDSFDTNGDGMVSLAEFDANLKPKTRAAIEAKLSEGWVFDKAKW